MYRVIPLIRLASLEAAASETITRQSLYFRLPPDVYSANLRVGAAFTAGSAGNVVVGVASIYAPNPLADLTGPRTTPGTVTLTETTRGGFLGLSPTANWLKLTIAVGDTVTGGPLVIDLVVYYQQSDTDLIPVSEVPLQPAFLEASVNGEQDPLVINVKTLRQAGALYAQTNGVSGNSTQMRNFLVPSACRGATKAVSITDGPGTADALQTAFIARVAAANGGDSDVILDGSDSVGRPLYANTWADLTVTEFTVNYADDAFHPTVSLPWNTPLIFQLQGQLDSGLWEDTDAWFAVPGDPSAVTVYDSMSTPTPTDELNPQELVPVDGQLNLCNVIFDGVAPRSSVASLPAALNNYVAVRVIAVVGGDYADDEVDGPCTYRFKLALRLYERR